MAGEDEEALCCRASPTWSPESSEVPRLPDLSTSLALPKKPRPWNTALCSGTGGVGWGDAAPLEQERRDLRGSTQSGFKTQWPGDTGQHAWSWPHLSLSCQEQHHMGRVSSDRGQQGSCPAEAARHLEVGMARRRNLAVGGEACRLGSQGGPPLRTTWGSALAWLQGPLATPAQDLLPCPTPMPCPAHSPDLQGTRETAGPGLVGHYESPRGKTLITL